MENSNNKLKDLIFLYEKLLKHLEQLASYTQSEQMAKDNIDKLEELNKAHVETRNFARVLLQVDFSTLSKNGIKSMVLKEVNTQSILFINLITDYNEKVICYIKEGKKEELIALIKDIQEFATVADKKFKIFKNQLKKIE